MRHLIPSIGIAVACVPIGHAVHPIVGIVFWFVLTGAYIVWQRAK